MFNMNWLDINQTKNIWVVSIIDNRKTTIERTKSYRTIIDFLSAFSNKFWLNEAFTKCELNLTFDSFQDLLLYMPNNEDIKEYLNKNGYNLIWGKVIKYDLKNKRNWCIFTNYEEVWEDIDTKKILEWAKSGSIYYWFLPIKKMNNILLVYATKNNIVKYTQEKITEIIN
jgi:hypothetical protein